MRGHSIYKKRRKEKTKKEGSFSVKKVMKRKKSFLLLVRKRGEENEMNLSQVDIRKKTDYYGPLAEPKQEVSQSRT